MATQSPREQLNALMAAMQEDQTKAISELNDLFQSEDLELFRNKIVELRDRTVPQSHYDQVLGSFLNIMDGVKMLVAQAMPPQIPAGTVVLENPPMAPAPTEQASPTGESAE